VTEQTAQMPFMEHLRELRSRVIKSAIAVTVTTVASFFFYEQVLAVLVKPYEIAVPGSSLVYFRPTEAFSLAMRISLWTGFILASPVILYQLWRFIAPALTPTEKRWAVPLTAVFVTLFLAGVVVGYYALYRGLNFLFQFGGSNLTPMIGADNYLKFSMRFLLAFGISFEFPVFLFAAAAVHAITSKQLRAAWRWAMVIILVFAAIITPSGDPLTLMMLSVPMYLLYEASILSIRIFLKR